MDWTLRPGDRIKTTDLNRQYGCSLQGGIRPSNRSKAVFLFADPQAGPAHGYRDQLQSDGVFHYTGTGRVGDQRLRGMNRSILEHRKAGRTLRLFRGSRDVVEYIGEFELNEADPFYYARARDMLGRDRQVVVFRLLAVGEVQRGT